MTRSMIALALALSASVPAWTPAWAIDTHVLTIEGNKFTPTELRVPSGERFRIEVRNQDKTPAEFESSDMRIEKIVVPGGAITVNAGPLRPGTYKFFDEYHPDTAFGTVVAEPR